MNNYSYEEFELLSDGEKADVLLTELAYRLFQKTKGAAAPTLVTMTDKILEIYHELNRREYPEYDLRELID